MKSSPHLLIQPSMKKRPITKAVFLVAGMGTRSLPASKAMPKEMFPIVDKPILQYIVEEFVDAGIKDIIFVTSNGKEAIENHFDRNFELEYRLEQSGKTELLDKVKRIGKLANFAYVRQDKPLGDGHALLAAAPFIDKGEAVAVCYGDDLIEGASGPAIGQLMEVYNEFGGCVTLVEDVGIDRVERFGVIDGEPVSDVAWKVSKFVEKPAKADAPSTYAHIGREILTAEYMDVLKNEPRDASGEIRLANAFDSYIKTGGSLHARILDGIWWDCGTNLAYAKTSMAYALKHTDMKDDILAYMKSLIEKS
ncbi:TPA: UTP--glucose-1-phosphate uridylyltransferase [Candidatus Uhrbacteria bacterium]|nr:UTP--glucose-1-phosphate uridylyltransferase [Candidatus Uhrbacteria bacterium]